MKYPRFPSVLASCWPRLRDEGWRWFCNREVDDVVDNFLLYEALCREHGENNVAIGQAWSEQSMEPRPHDEIYGFYVRDVFDQLRAFSRELDAL